MASKTLTWSGSSASLVSSSSSSGVKALCFAPRSLSFPAKKISPLVGVVRAQNNEDSQSDFEQLRNSFFDRIADDKPIDDSEFAELGRKWKEIEGRRRLFFGSGINPPLTEEEFLRGMEPSGIQLKISQLVSHADDQVQRSSDEDMFNIIRRAMIASDERMSIQLKKLLNCSSIPRLISIDRELSNSIMDGSGSIRERRFDSTTEKEFKVVYDISGEDASKLEVTILGDKLKIGFKPPEDKVEVLRRALIRLFGTQITLPPRCETEKAKAVLKNGILVVRIPRKTID